MDCEQVKEVLDAYALGAVPGAEAEALEQHVADCVRCWEELNQAQRAAALLTLSTAVERAPPGLGRRIMDEARRQAPSREAARLLTGLRRLWPAAAGALAAAGVAALVLALFVRAEMDDLRDENGQLQRQVQETGSLLGQQRQLMAVLAAPDLQQVSLRPSRSGSDAVATYYWSQDGQSGFLVCNKLPPLEEGQSYHVWVLSDGDATAAGTLAPWRGIGQLPVDLSVSDRRPSAISVTIEDGAGGEGGEPFLYAPLQSGE